MYMSETESFIVFPIESTYVLTLVTHTLDFITGKVDVAGGTDLSLSGRLDQDKLLHSVMFYADQSFNVEIVCNDELQFKGPIPAGLFNLKNITFNLIRIDAIAAQTTIIVYTSTHADAFGGNSL